MLICPKLQNEWQQCRPGSDAAERGVWPGSTLFAQASLYEKKSKPATTRTGITKLWKCHLSASGMHNVRTKRANITFDLDLLIPLKCGQIEVDLKHLIVLCNYFVFYWRTILNIKHDSKSWWNILLKEN